MTFPAYIYLTVVQVHSPTRQMYFYECNQSGVVVDFRNENIFDDSSQLEYRVEFQCKGGGKLKDWIKSDNLRRAMEK